MTHTPFPNTPSLDSPDLVFSTPRLHACGRTAIRSIAAMTYQQAYNLVQNRPPDDPTGP